MISKRKYEAVHSLFFRHKGIVHPKKKICCSFIIPQTIKDYFFFFSGTVKKIFSWHCAALWFIKCKSMATGTVKVKKYIYTGMTNSLSDAWQSLCLNMSWNNSVSDPVINELIQCSSSSNSHWTEETVRLGLKTNEPLIRARVNPTLEWRDELRFLWFLMVYVERWRLVYSL